MVMPNSFFRLPAVAIDYARHSMSCNFAFGDGHVEAVSYGKINSNPNGGGLYDFYWWPGIDGIGGDKNH